MAACYFHYLINPATARTVCGSETSNGYIAMRINSICRIIASALFRFKTPLRSTKALHMSSRTLFRYAPFLAFIVGTLTLFGAENSAVPEPGDLRAAGTVDFPVSCVPAVRAEFIRGVALLHSFFYEEAR